MNELAIILCVLIVCATILVAIYMSLCSENEVGMFANPQHEERIGELEKVVKELMQSK